MKKYLLSSLFLLLPYIGIAQESFGIGEKIDKVFQNYTSWFVELVFYEIPFSENFKIPWVLLVLIGGAVFFTFYFRLINITHFRTSLNVIKGKYDDKVKEKDSEKVEGEVSHFQALTAALSATVGLGNIAGVAVALSIGGPGATFWMIVAGFIGMASKFTECTLGVKFRDIGPDGKVYGGPMYYLKKGLSEKGMGSFGKILAVLFAIFAVGGSLGGGNMFQANQAAAQFVLFFDLQNTNATIWFGIILTLLVAVVIIGGIKRIAKVTEKIIPFMAVIYIIAALIILTINYVHILPAFQAIIDGAFSGTGIAGGVIGVMIQGIRRGAFSNEAGVGSAAIAHAAVRTNYPASEGIVALLEPFIDTVIICTMTALVIIITNFDHNIVQYGQEVTEGVGLTALAFDSALPHFSGILTLSVLLFAFSTMISWAYYGMQGWVFLFGRSKKTELIYKSIFCFFTFIGASVSLGAIVDFSDAMVFGMVVPNIIGLLILLPIVKKELKRYLAVIKVKKEV